MVSLPDGLKELIRARMKGPGDYHIIRKDQLAAYAHRLKSGDTVSLHGIGDGPPTLYNVGEAGELEKIWPKKK